MTTAAPVLPDVTDDTRDEIDEAGRCRCRYVRKLCPEPCHNQIDGEDGFCSLCRKFHERKTDEVGHCHVIIADGWTRLTT